MILSELAEKLTAAGSWCGETHIQKTVYLLQTLTHTRLGYDFVLYKHGPFSFDLRDELTGFRADGLFLLRPRPPYGPSLEPTEAVKALKKNLKAVLDRAAVTISLVVSAVGPKSVAELERLATALYVTRERKATGIHNRAARLSAIKPHIRFDQAITAIETIDALSDEVSAKLVVATP